MVRPLDVHHRNSSRPGSSFGVRCNTLAYTFVSHRHRYFAHPGPWCEWRTPSAVRHRFVYRRPCRSSRTDRHAVRRIQKGCQAVSRASGRLYGSSSTRGWCRVFAGARIRDGGDENLHFAASSSVKPFPAPVDSSPDIRRLLTVASLAWSSCCGQIPQWQLRPSVSLAAGIMQIRFRVSKIHCASRPRCSGDAGSVHQEEFQQLMHRRWPSFACGWRPCAGSSDRRSASVAYRFIVGLSRRVSQKPAWNQATTSCWPSM